MNLTSNLTVYLKMTETCNLNCMHCFTSGKHGKKIFANPTQIINFMKRLYIENPGLESIRYLFHGGEPLLAPIEKLEEIYNGLKNVIPNTTFSMQTNLVFPLNENKRHFLKTYLHEYGFGTSWDYDIRFGSGIDDVHLRNKIKDEQKKLWELNVRKLIHEDGHFLTMIVSITKGLIENCEPIDIINYAVSLGFQNILFERITSDGNAKKNSEIIPSNRDQDEWLYKMFKQTFEHKTYEKIYNMFLAELAEGFVNRNHIGNRCRTCEMSILTINADGSIGGCPNTAPANTWGHINWDIRESFSSQKRLEIISCEKFNRNSLCYSCDAFSICNSDCHQLAWDENETRCAAPKSIWKEMIAYNEVEKYKLLLSHKTVEHLVV